MKRFLTLLLALSLVLSMSAFAAAGDPGTIKSITIDNTTTTEVVYADGDVNFSLTYKAATKDGFYLILVLKDLLGSDLPTAGDILYVDQVTATGNSITFDNVYPKEIEADESYIYLVGTGVGMTKLGTIVPNKAAVSNLTVNAIGSGRNVPSYTVDGRVVTVTYSLPCKLGYENASGTYTAIKAVANADGSYSYTVPEGINEVTVVAKGDVTGDGRLMANDTVQVKAAQLRKQTFTNLQLFAGDVTGDGRLMANDTVQVKSAQLRKLTLTW